MTVPVPECLCTLWLAAPAMIQFIYIYIYIYAFIRRFYPKRLTLHCIQVTVSTFFQVLLSLGIEPMILALLAPCSTSWATGKFIESLRFRRPLKQVTLGGGGAGIWTWALGLCLVWAHYPSSHTPRFTHWWCWRSQKYGYLFFYYNDLLLSLIKPFLVELYVCVHPMKKWGGGLN